MLEKQRKHSSVSYFYKVVNEFVQFPEILGIFQFHIILRFIEVQLHYMFITIVLIMDHIGHQIGFHN